MANTTPSRQMSLVPYTGSGEVVLRRGNAVVVYDAQSHELSVRNTASDEQALEVAECPYCHRPLRDEYDARRDSGERRQREFGDYEPQQKTQQQHPFVDPHYFAMLARSQRPSPNTSAPRTPDRLPIPALRSGRSREASGSGVSRFVDPPTGAEFVGSDPATSSSKGISNSAFTPGYFQQFFRELAVLGKGGNGVVLLVEHVMDEISLGKFACKRVPVGNNHSWLEKVLLEVKLLQGIMHKNLVTYHWVWLEDYQSSKFGPSIPCLWILQEYCNGGDLHSYVSGPSKEVLSSKENLKERFRRNSKGEAMFLPQEEQLGYGKLSFEEIFSFFRDITSGLHHLHSKGYIHRDLKPSNCLLHLDDTRTRVLISDFGEVQAAGSNRGNTGATGTISYCAPEVLRQDATSQTFGNFTTKSDIFSLGMIVYFMCFGRLPYTSADGIDEEKEDLEELRGEILRWSGFGDEERDMRALRSDLPEKLYKFLKRLLSVDPNERPSTDEILLSIKTGGAGLSDANPPSSVIDDNESSRVSALEEMSAPSQRPPQQFRSKSAYFNNNSSSSSSNSKSSSTPPITTADRQDKKSRSLSPTKSRHAQLGKTHLNRSGPTSPTQTHSKALTAHPRKVDLPPAPFQSSAAPSPPMQSPRLMLGPPPAPTNRSLQTWLRHVVSHQQEPVLKILKVISFLVKLITMSIPCSPFAPNTWVFYPLLAVATLEVAGIIKPVGIRRLVLLLCIHLAVIYTVAKNGWLCEMDKPGMKLW